MQVVINWYILKKKVDPTKIFKKKVYPTKVFEEECGSNKDFEKVGLSNKGGRFTRPLTTPGGP